MLSKALLRGNAKMAREESKEREGERKKKQASKLIFQSCLLFQEGVTCSNDLILLVVM